MSDQPARHVRERLWLMSDYQATTPVWTGIGQPLGDLGSLRITTALAAALVEWQQYFDAHFSWHGDLDDNGGWDDTQHARVYADNGIRLRELLAAELPDTEVVLDLWPVTGTAPSV